MCVWVYVYEYVSMREGIVIQRKVYVVLNKKT